MWGGPLSKIKLFLTGLLYRTQFYICKFQRKCCDFKADVITIPTPFDLPRNSLDFCFHNLSTIIKLTCTTSIKKESLHTSAPPSTREAK
jgi:hypothetical protein